MKLKKQLAENQMHQMGYQDAMDGLRMVYKYKDNEDYVKGYEEGSQQKEKESGEDYMPIQKTDLTVASLEEMIKEVMQEYGYGRRRGPMTKKQKKAKQMSWNRKVSELVKAMGGSVPMSSWTSDMAFHYNKGKSPQEAAEIFMARTKEEPMEEASTSASGAAGGYSKKKKVYQEE